MRASSCEIYVSVTGICQGRQEKDSTGWQFCGEGGNLGNFIEIVEGVEAKVASLPNMVLSLLNLQKGWEYSLYCSSFIVWTKVNEAELPFLKGIEVLPLMEVHGDGTEEGDSGQNITLRTSHCLVATLNDTSDILHQKLLAWMVSMTMVFQFSECFSPTSSLTFPQSPYVALPGHLHHWQLWEGSTGVAVLYHWRLGPMVWCGCQMSWTVNFLRKKIEARNFIAAKSVELRAFSDKVQRGSVFFFFRGQNYAKRLGWRNKLKQVYSWGMWNVTSMH